jgi:hypothetical protein
VRRAARLRWVPVLLMLAACGGGGESGGGGGDPGGNGGGGVPGGNGGGGGGGEVPGGDGVSPSGDSPPRDPSFVVGSSIAGLSLIGFQGDGTLRTGNPESVVNLATGAVTGGVFAGTLNAARTRIDLAAGGTVELTDPGATEYVRLFRTEPLTGDPVFGVTGFPSAPGDLPASGRVAYTGAAQIEAADATRLYTLAGTGLITADFGDGEVRIELRDLAGSAQGVSPGNTGTVAVPPGGRITVDGSAISGAGFAGGRASASGLPFGITDSADASGTRGGFFGPGADEVGGRVVVSDPAGDVGILGTFAAD